jgi:hypothetical protein
VGGTGGPSPLRFGVYQRRNVEIKEQASARISKSFKGFVMGRQPLVRTISPHRAYHANLRFGVSAIMKRPESSKLIGDCMAKWSYIETEMAVVLGILLKTESTALLAVFQILRRSSSQREAIEEAAKTALESHHQDLLTAILNVHRAIEADRNFLAHGIIGECDEVPDGILWIQPSDIMALRIRFHLEHDFEFSEQERKDLADKAYVYRNSDLQRIGNDVHDLWDIWFEFRSIAHYPTASGEGYRRLCDRPRIAQELARRQSGSANPI